MTQRGKREKPNAYPVSHMDRAIGVFDKCIALLKSLFSSVKSNWKVLPKAHRIGISVLTSILFLLVVIPASETGRVISSEEPQEVFIPVHLKENDDTQTEAAVDEVYESILPLTPVESIQHVVINSDVETETDDLGWINHKVGGGDTLAGIFRAQKLPLPDLYAITAIEGKEKPLSQIKPGQRFRFKRNTEGEIEELQVETQNKQWVAFSRLSDDSFKRMK